MSHSTHVGFREPPAWVRRFSPPSRPELPGPPIPSLCVGVAQGVRHKPDPVAPVRGAKGRRWEMVPLRIEPARGKVPKDDVQSSSSESWDVLHDDVAWS